MALQHSVDNAEIDLLDLIATLWNEKVTIAGFVVLAVLIGGVYVSTVQTPYVTKVKYQANLIPPFVTRESLPQHVSRTFFSADIFSRWKAEAPNTFLVFDMFNETKIIDGVVFELGFDKGVVSFVEAKKNKKTYIEIKSNDIQLIDEVLSYFKFVNLALAKKYEVSGQRQRSRLENLENRFGSSDSASFFSWSQKKLELDEYLQNAAEGRKPILISRPTPPINTGVSRVLLLITALVCGATAGATFVLIRNAYRVRKLRPAELNP